MAVRKRTIERAPTSPRDKAKDDLIMEITTVVVIVIMTRFFEKIDLFDKAFP